MEIISFKGGVDRNLSYLVYNELSKEAIIVDPFDNIEIYLKEVKNRNLKLIGIVNTHSHSDHIQGNDKFIALKYKVINALKKNKLILGNEEIKVIKTPGHSDDSICLYLDNKLITGDVLIVNRVGMTRDKEHSKILYNSLKKLTKLPKNTKVYPGHYYNSDFPSTIGKELTNNPYLKAKNVDEFETLMSKWREYTRDYHIKRKK